MLAKKNSLRTYMKKTLRKLKITESKDYNCIDSNIY
jgi:hypothetical protein